MKTKIAQSAPVPHLESLETRTLLASVSGVAYVDTNYTGSFEIGEAISEAPTVYLDLDNSGTLNGEPSATPGPNGYTFTGLAAGTYRIRAIAPAGSMITGP